jgi:hypothetical protein
VTSSSNLLEKLTGNDRRSIGRSNEVVALVLRQPVLFAELIHGMRSADRLVRMRAADAVEKVSVKQPELLTPFRPRLLSLLEEASEQELRWHLAQMVPRLRLTRKQSSRAAAAFRCYLADRSSIVKTSALQALADIGIKNASFVPEIKTLLQDSMKSGTAAMKARARKLLPRFEAL